MEEVQSSDVLGDVIAFRDMSVGAIGLGTRKVKQRNLSKLARKISSNMKR